MQRREIQIVRDSSKPGDGRQFPQDHYSLKIKYRCYLQEQGGEKNMFDDTMADGFDVKLNSGNNVAGLEHVLKLMSLGEQVQAWIPWQQGYGAGGMPAYGIPASADMYFDPLVLETMEPPR